MLCIITLFWVNLGWFLVGVLVFFKILWLKAILGKNFALSFANFQELPTEKIEETLAEPMECVEIYLSIIVPMFNEQNRLPLMLADCQKTIMSTGLKHKNIEFILVDDGSTDATPKVAYSFSQSTNHTVRYIRLLENTGKGAAVKQGALLACGEFILFADADGATPFGQILSFLHVAEQKRRKGVSKFVLYGIRSFKKRKLMRILFSKAFRLVNSQILNVHAEDTQCGFKLFSKEAASEIFRNIHLKRWGFDLEIFQICNMNDIPLVKINVPWEEISGSKLNVLRDSMGMFLDVLLIKICYATRLWILEK